jgi:diguanylate cyclase (GGDEF)-like protein/PAS domain S-box-containing protein
MSSFLSLKVRLAFGFAMLTLLLMGVVSYHWMVISDESDRWVWHTHEVLMNIQDQLLDVQKIEASCLQFVLTGKESDLELHRANETSLKLDRDAFQKLTADNPVQQRRVPALAQLAAEIDQQTNAIINLRVAKGQAAAVAVIETGQGQQGIVEFETLAGEMKSEEALLRQVRLAAADRDLSQTKIVLIVGTLLGMLIAGIAGWTASRDSDRRAAAEESLRVSEEKYRTLLDGVQDYAIFMLDPQGLVDSWSAAAERIKGYTAEQIIGHSFSCFFLPEDIRRGRPEEVLRIAATTGRHEELGMRVRRDGSEFLASVAFIALRDGAGNLRGFSEVCHDLSEHKESEARYRGLLEAAPDGMVVVNQEGKIVLLNAQTEKQFGYRRDELLGESVTDIIPEGFAERLIEDGTRTAAAALAQQIGSGIELHGRRKDRSEFPIEIMLSPLESAEGMLVTAAIRDITTRKNAEANLVQKVEALNRSNEELVRLAHAARTMTQRMTHAAEHDALTGLPNRLLLNDRIGQAIAFAQRHENQVAVLFLDLDGFKHINDSLGHPTGDKLLQSLAKRLVSCVRATDTVSRQGGDEFVVLISEINQPEDAISMSRRLLHVVAGANSIEKHDLHITASIGVSIYPDDGLDAETLIKNADTAMYHAKENGRQSFQFFTPAMNAQAVERQLIEEHLRRALERQEFTLHYQPKINIGTGAITGVEALIRWTNPTLGSVPPGQFVPVAEDCGLIVPIGAWVLREACTQAKAWADAGLPLMTMAVNVSAMQFRSETFLDGLFAILSETGLDPNHLELELTESALMKRAEFAASILSTLREKGVTVAIDDFGTGYSSLSYLRKFPLDALKIDQSFVRQITTVPDETIIVRAIIGMGRSLNLRVIAEGVETPDQLEFLKAHQCEEAQGYYFSRPVPPQQLVKLLESWDLIERTAANVA